MRDLEEEAEIKLSSGIAAFEARHFTQAMKLLSPLAETGLAQAQYRLAIMYQNGLGVVRNELLGYKWMKCAAQQDYGPALHGLGFMYMDGDCAAQDDARAFQWFEAAAEQGLAGRRRRALVDQVAASVILQAWLATQREVKDR